MSNNCPICLRYSNRVSTPNNPDINAKRHYLVYTRFGETKQSDVLEVRTVVLRHDLERFRKVARCCDVVTAYRHDELPKHHQVLLYLCRRYGHSRHARRRGGVVREHVRESARADPHAVLARDDNFGDVNHAYCQALVVCSLHRTRNLDDITPERPLRHVRLGSLQSPMYERRRAGLDVRVVQRLSSRVVGVGNNECWG
jgi:hypothetical protein